MTSDILIDTNVLVRFFVRDNESQFRQAKELIEKIESGKIRGLISILVVNELIWILENYYDFDRKIYLPQLLKLLALKDIKIIEVKKAILIEVLEKMLSKKIDFTNIYLLQIAEKRKLFSFDKDLIKFSQ